MLAKRYEFQKSEPEHQRFWEENQIYTFSPDPSREPYSIDTPPPTISGKLHIGHIFSYTQAEIIARFQRMQGRNVFYHVGFDYNGLPTERLVEKEHGVAPASMKRSEFNALCMETSRKYENEFKALWKSLGFSCDWNLQYETISPLSQKISQRSFLELVKMGKAYHKESPVLWCTHCRTSIAQADLDTTETDTTFNTIPFLVDGQELLIATTRPELLYGCTALFIHPQDARYQGLLGKTAIVPLYQHEIPIMADERVAMDKGTGAVMCATFGDTTDLEWYSQYNLSYRRVLLPDGTIDQTVPYIGGLKVMEARKQIISLLSEEGLLRRSDSILHTVSIHERCGKPIEIIPSRQWYIAVMQDKDAYLKAGDEINWYPQSMKQRYRIWVENLKWDWCISRQRYFGVPFPVWYCKDCGKAMLAEENALPVNPLETSPSRACSCGCREFTPETAVLDTWATSSVSPLINARWGEPDEKTELLPMSMRTQAHEIIRTWTFYTIVKSICHTGKIPWKDIMICGFVMAKRGEKFSKSKENANLSPTALIAKHSADGLRYWAASARLGTDTLFSEDELGISGRFLTKLWNAAKFCLMHLEDYKGETPEKLLSIDKWILDRCRETMKLSREYLEQYETGLARHEIDELFWRDFCDNYLEIVKDRLYKPEIHGREHRLSAQYALYHSFLSILKLYAPFVPHITEEIYQGYYREREGTLSVHQTLWPKEMPLSRDILEFGEIIKAIIGEVRRYKSERNLSLKTELEQLKIVMEKRFFSYYNQIRKDLMACTGTRSITLLEGPLSVEIRRSQPAAERPQTLSRT